MSQIKARAIITNEKNDVFLVKVWVGGQQLFCLPWGTLDEGETVLECLHREIVEELGVEPVIGKLVAVNSFVRKNWQSVCDVWYEVTNWEAFSDIDTNTTSHGFEILEYGFYNSNTVPDIYKPDDLFDRIKKW